MVNCLKSIKFLWRNIELFFWREEYSLDLKQLLVYLQIFMSTSCITICPTFSLILLILIFILLAYSWNRAAKSMLVKLLWLSVSSRVCGFFHFSTWINTNTGTIWRYTSLAECFVILTATFDTIFSLLSSSGFY